MPINILMPALSPTMTEGTLAKWLVKEGDAITAGDIIAEIETDKATMEVEAVDEGTVGKIVVAEGTDGVPVNQVIAVLLEEGEDASAIVGAPEAKPAPAPSRSRPNHLLEVLRCRPPPRRRRRRPPNERLVPKGASSPARWRAASPRRRASTWRP